MLRSRVSSSVDVGRLSMAVSRPGIDPRVWVSYAVLASEPYIETIEGQQDVIVDIKLMPMGEEETARVGAIYAGNGFGFYCPLHEGDEVLVVAPSGDPDEGLVVMQRLWSPADPPPSELTDHPEDVTLVVQPGKSLRVAVKGEGNIVLAADAGKVYLGAETGTEPAAKGQTLKDYLDSVVESLNTHVHQVTDIGMPTTPCTAATPPTTFVGPTEALLATKTEVL